MSDTASKIFAGYDIMIGVDVSASMNHASVRNPAISRFQEVEELAYSIALQAAPFDDDGLDVITFGVGASITTGVTPQAIADIFKGGAKQGATDLDALVNVAAARQRKTGKNTIVIVFTDGAPSDEGKAAQAIIAATKNLTADENLTFGFVQVGNDPAATAYLRHLDDGLQAKGAKFDIVDAITSDEAARMDVLEMLTKFIND